MLIKKSITIKKHRTSLSLEKEFWDEIVALSKQNNTTPDRLISDIDQKKTTSNLSSAIRLYVLNHLKNQTYCQAVKKFVVCFQK